MFSSVRPSFALEIKYDACGSNYFIPFTTTVISKEDPWNPWHITTSIFFSSYIKSGKCSGTSKLVDLFAYFTFKVMSEMPENYEF